MTNDVTLGFKDRLDGETKMLRAITNTLCFHALGTMSCGLVNDHQDGEAKMW